MMWRAHFSVGAAFGALGATEMPEHVGVIVPSALVGSLIPDLDHPRSKLGRWARPLPDLILKLFGHRGGTHSLVFCLGLGLLSHLLAEAVSYSGKGFLTIRGAGVPAAWPATRARFGVRLVQVDGLLEHFIFFSGCLAAAGYLTYHALGEPRIPGIL